MNFNFLSLLVIMTLLKALYYILIFYTILTFIIFMTKQTIHQIKCNQIYNQKEIYTKQYIIYNFLSNKECDEIINESENYSKNMDGQKIDMMNILQLIMKLQLNGIVINIYLKK